MITETTKLILSVISIIVIAMLVYKKKYGWAWALSTAEALLVLLNI